MILSSTREGDSPQTAMHTIVAQTVHQLERGMHMWRGLTEAEKRCITQYYARLQAQGEQRVLDLLGGR